MTISSNGYSIVTHSEHQTVPQAFKEVNAYYGNILNSVLTARLILSLREAGSTRASMQQCTPVNNGSWEMKVISKVVDDFDDSVGSTSIENHHLTQYPNLTFARS